MKEWIKEIIKKEQFDPEFLGIFLNPYYFARKELHRKIKELSPNLTGKILDVGCGQKPYKKLFNFTEYLGIDIQPTQGGHSHKDEEIDIFYDGKKFPLKEAEFDSVICSQVLEHVFEPDLFIKEINRVLKNNGYLLLTVPFIWEEHETPYDYARYTSFGLEHLLTKNGFEIVSKQKTNLGVRTIMQIIISDFQDKITTRFGHLNFLLSIILVSPLNIFGILLSLIFTRNKNLYLDNIFLVRKKFNV
jgi:SAM-dependent methyltransferase